jgi:hypothetical protein
LQTAAIRSQTLVQRDGVTCVLQGCYSGTKQV